MTVHTHFGTWEVPLLVFRVRNQTTGKTRDYRLDLLAYSKKHQILELLCHRLGRLPETMDKAFWGSIRFH